MKIGNMVGVMQGDKFYNGHVGVKIFVVILGKSSIFATVLIFFLDKKNFILYIKKFLFFTCFVFINKNILFFSFF